MAKMREMVLSEDNLLSSFKDLTKKEVGNELFYVGSEVCLLLGYGYSDYTNVLNKLTNDNLKLPYINRKGKKINTRWISESDMYRLFFKSKRPEANILLDYVCEEILPSIREKGYFSINEFKLLK